MAPLVKGGAIVCPECGNKITCSTDKLIEIWNASFGYMSFAEYEATHADELLQDELDFWVFKNPTQ